MVTNCNGCGEEWNLFHRDSMMIGSHHFCNDKCKNEFIRDRRENGWIGFLADKEWENV